MLGLRFLLDLSVVFVIISIIFVWRRERYREGDKNAFVLFLTKLQTEIYYFKS